MRVSTDWRQQVQRGQVLMEFVVAVALLTMLSVFAASEWGQKVQQLKINAMAAWLMDIHYASHLRDSKYPAHANHQKHDDHKTDVTAFIRHLKELAYLPSGFAVDAPMNYEVSLVTLAPKICSGDDCVGDTLLVAMPHARTDSDRAQNNALDLLLALQGRGGVVPLNQPGIVAGPGMRYEGVRWRGQLLPVGSVALSLSGSATAWSFVRLREDRDVSLSGSVLLGSNVRFLKPPHADEGLVIGKTVAAGSVCRTDKQLALLAGGGLALCQSGHWQAVRQARQFQACEPMRVVESDVYQQGLMLMSNLGSASMGPAWQCNCSAGFIARYLGPATNRFQGVTVTGGYLCESF